MYQSKESWSGYTIIRKSRFQSKEHYHGLRGQLRHEKVVNLPRRHNNPNVYAPPNGISKSMKHNNAQARLVFKHNNVKIMEFGKLLFPQGP